jgi:hypothetical protein
VDSTDGAGEPNQPSVLVRAPQLVDAGLVPE